MKKINIDIFINKLSKGFQSLDYQGKLPTLTINNNKSFKTSYGGILSLLFYLSILSFIIIFAVDMLSNKDFKVNSSEKIGYDNTLDINDMFYMFTVRDSSGYPIRND